MVADAARSLRFIIRWAQRHAYTRNATAPPTIERASSAAKSFPSAEIVMPNVASATEGAAPKSPAKLLGFKISAIIAKSETTEPPIKKRTTSSFIKTPHRALRGIE